MSSNITTIELKYPHRIITISRLFLGFPAFSRGKRGETMGKRCLNFVHHTLKSSLRTTTSITSRQGGSDDRYSHDQTHKLRQV